MTRLQAVIEGSDGIARRNPDGTIIMMPWSEVYSLYGLPSSSGSTPGDVGAASNGPVVQGTRADLPQAHTSRGLVGESL